MHTVANIQKKLKLFDAFARKHATSDNAIQAYKKYWKTLFSLEMDTTSAKGFVEHYRNMVKRTITRRRNKKGGSLQGAPLDYTMTPGINSNVYGRFPVEVDTDPASIRDMDVYFNSAILKGCNQEVHAFPTVPEGMGSNKVGGGRRSRRHHGRTRRLHKRRGTHRRNHRGGNMMQSLLYHPYISSNPPNMIQQATAQWSGATEPVPFSGKPENHAWNYASSGIRNIIDPGIITPISSDLTKLASPPPWQTTQ